MRCEFHLIWQCHAERVTKAPESGDHRARKASGASSRDTGGWPLIVHLLHAVGVAAVAAAAVAAAPQLL